MKVKTAVVVYNALRGINASKLPTAAKADLIGIIRATRALKVVAESYSDFERDAAERLRPADFVALMEKRSNYNGLSAAEQQEVTEKLMTYERAFGECVGPELDKEVSVDSFDALSESALAGIASASENMTMETLLLIEEVCC